MKGGNPSRQDEWSIDESVERKLIFDSISMHHEYIQHTFSQLISWYAFFITANIVTGGWFVVALLEDKDDVSVYLFLFEASVFLMANAIAIMICVFVKQSLKEHEGSIISLINLTGFPIDASIEKLFVVIPSRLYNSVPLGMIATFVCLIILWVAVPAYVVFTQFIG